MMNLASFCVTLKLKGRRRYKPMLQNVWEKTGERLADVIEDGSHAARHAARRVTNAADDLVEGTTRTIKKHPLATVTAAFAVAFASGMLVGRFARRR